MDPKYSPYPEPALIFPEAGSYMPLYSAAQWIATRGLSIVPDELDEEDWRVAYRSLINAIVAGNVRSSGVRAGERQLIPNHAFAACNVIHFWEGYQEDISGGQDLYLRCGVCAHDEQWRNGNDDALTNKFHDVTCDVAPAILSSLNWSLALEGGPDDEAEAVYGRTDHWGFA